MKRLLLLVGSVLAAGSAAWLAGTGTPANAESTCPGTHLDADDQTTFTYTAPTGFLITSYCVKAGSDVQGDGPEIHVVSPPATSVTFSHSSGKEISHFSVTLIPKVPPSTTTTSTSLTTTTTNPCPAPPCIPNTQGATTTTSPTTSSSVATTSTTSSPPSTTSSTTSTSPSITSTSSPPPSSSSSTSTTTLPDTFTFGAAASVCRAEVPTIVIQFQNQFPSLAGQTGTLTMSDVNGNIVSTQPLTYQPGTTVELLYPGTTVNPDGSIADVPGWTLQSNGLWVRDPSDEFLREGINLTFTVNPTATAFVTYPPESSACANPDGPFPATPTPTLPVTR